MLDRYSKEISYCTFCPKLCRFACPVAKAEHSETSIPTVRQELLSLIRSGRLALTPETAEVFNHCAFCLHCRSYCHHLIEVPVVMEEARALASPYRGERAEQFLHRFRQDHTPYGPRLWERISRIVPPEARIEGAQVAFFPGCTSTWHSPEDLSDTWKIFRYLKIDYVGFYSGDDFCCGMPLLNLGDHAGFQEQAERLAEKLRKYKLIITGCPACMYAFRVRYEQSGVRFPPKVQHISEFLLEKGEDLKGLPPDPHGQGEVYYHDPCYLGRYLGIYDAPRQLLARVRGTPAREFTWSRDDAVCCGGGGGLPLLLPDTSRRIAGKRIEEFRSRGGHVLASACPSCKQTFQKADAVLEVRDIVNLIAARVSELQEAGRLR